MVTTALLVITTYPNINGPITVPEGSNVVLKCGATGERRLNYQWKKESGALPRYSKNNGGRSITLHNLVSDDSGQYYCEVSIGRNKVASKRVQVNVKS